MQGTEQTHGSLTATLVGTARNRKRPGTGNGPAPIPRALGAEAGRSHTTCCAQQEGMNRACDGTDGGWQRPGTVRTARLQPRDHTRT